MPGTIKVLLVDDDRIDRMAIERLVRSQNLPYDLDMAASLHEARGKLASNVYDMVMLDYMLGDGTGAELIPETKGAPVIFVTGSGDELIAVNAMKLGAYDYLIKDPERNYLTILPQTVETVLARKKAEDAVRQLSSVVEQTGDSVTITDAEGRIKYVNPAFCALTGYAPEEAIGNTPRLLKSNQHEAGFYQNLWETLLAGETFRAEFHNRKKDGTIYSEEKTITPIKNSAGAITHFVSTGRDITQRKKAEQELRHAKEKAEEATRLKDKFVSLVSHDLRGPLATMLGFLRLTLGGDEPLLSPDSRKRIQIAIDSAEKMNELIEELLSVSRLKTGKVQPQSRFIDIYFAGAKLLMTFGPIAESKGIFLVNGLPPKKRIFADPILFYQVLQNLVGNAIKFCRRGDTVQLHLLGDDPAVIAVSDTGVGIEAERLQHLFDYDVKTSTTGTAGETGTGLGLPLSRDIMLAHGGDLRVESNPDSGTVFKAILPAVRPRLLLVEDDAFTTTYLKKMLAPLELEIVTAPNGREGMEAVSASIPHIILTDLIMPVMDGYSFIKELKLNNATKDIPIIVMTSSGVAEREKVFLLGANDFVQKPINPEELSPRINRLIS